jgi:hypothetical protein
MGINDWCGFASVAGIGVGIELALKLPEPLLLSGWRNCENLRQQGLQTVSYYITTKSHREPSPLQAGTLSWFGP